jgi:hypothetical protein
MNNFRNVKDVFGFAAHAKNGGMLFKGLDENPHSYAVDGTWKSFAAASLASCIDGAEKIFWQHKHPNLKEDRPFLPAPTKNKFLKHYYEKCITAEGISITTDVCWKLRSPEERTTGKFSLTDKDIFAYSHLKPRNALGRNRRIAEDYFIQYLNGIKIGTKVANPYDHYIVTADPVPHVTHEELIKTYGLKIAPLQKFDFDEEKKIFVPQEQTELQKAMDRNKQEELEEFLGMHL